MAHAEQIQPGQYKISGVLDFSTVTGLKSQLTRIDRGEADMLLDFSGVERTNSAALALIMDLLADARQKQRKLTFSNLPDTLLDLARMSNVEHLLVGSS